jgi:hypothetical protein
MGVDSIGAITGCTLVIGATTSAGKTPASTAPEAQTPRTCYSRRIMLMLPGVMAQVVVVRMAWVYEEALVSMRSLLFVTVLMYDAEHPVVT